MRSDFVDKKYHTPLRNYTSCEDQLLSLGHPISSCVGRGQQRRKGIEEEKSVHPSLNEIEIDFNFQRVHPQQIIQPFHSFRNHLATDRRDLWQLHCP